MLLPYAFQGLSKKISYNVTDKSPFSVKQPRKTKGRDRLMLKKTREGKKEVKKEVEVIDVEETVKKESTEKKVGLKELEVESSTHMKEKEEKDDGGVKKVEGKSSSQVTKRRRLKRKRGDEKDEEADRKAGTCSAVMLLLCFKPARSMPLQMYLNSLQRNKLCVFKNHVDRKQRLDDVELIFIADTEPATSCGPCVPVFGSVWTSSRQSND